MKIISIDQAARLSGWSYWEGENPVEWGVVEPSPKNAKGGKRLSSLRKQFKELLETYKPDIVLIEDPVGNEDSDSTPTNNWKTMQTLCQVQGVLMQLIDEENMDIQVISPSSWQYTCGIHKRDRQGRKNGAKDFVEKKYELSDVPQDIIDSFCISYHFHNGKSSEERSAF